MKTEIAKVYKRILPLLENLHERLKALEVETEPEDEGIYASKIEEEEKEKEGLDGFAVRITRGLAKADAEFEQNVEAFKALAKKQKFKQFGKGVCYGKIVNGRIEEKEKERAVEWMKEAGAVDTETEIGRIRMRLSVLERKIVKLTSSK